MRQRASSAAALFTAAVLGRVTTASAFVHPAQILHQHTTFAQHPVHTQTGSRRLTALSLARRQPHRRFSAFLSDGSKADRGGHDGEGGEVWPRVLVVARRHNRKNKFVDFVGEYHISLLQESGACPILIPRTDGTLSQLEAYLVGGVDGLLVMEGNDIGERYRPYGDGPSGLPEDLLSAVKCKYEGDVETDAVKDSIEMRLVRELVLRRNVPYLGLCRGSQLLNVAMGGTLYWDIAAETGSMVPHMDYDNYDGHRHDVVVRPDTPLAEWFAEQCTGPLAAEARLSVNSYHHQGVKALAPGLTPMCFSDDGMIEGFYDPRQFDPGAGAFRVGLQWHPERMLGDYPGCRRVYEAFVRAAAAHRRRAEAEEARFAQRAAEAAVRARMAEWQPAEHRGATLAGAGARHQRRLAHNRASLRTPGASKALRVEDARWAA